MFRSGSPDQLTEALPLSVSSNVPRGYLPLYETQMQAANRLTHANLHVIPLLPKSSILIANSSGSAGEASC